MDNSTAASENLPHHRANHWKEDEDQKLIQLVQQHGPQHWNAIAQHIHGRTAKGSQQWKFARAGQRFKLFLPCNIPRPHHNAFFHMRNFNAAQTAPAPVCSSASFSPANFGSVPSFSESFPAAAAAAAGGGGGGGMMKKGLFHGSSSAEFEGSSSSEKNQAHDAGFKDATFYDFLGVGADDDE
ncbi:hypothetical protein ACSQ67_000606 [Phaseolus vulgaris]